MLRQSWTDFIHDYYYCQSCGLVDRDVDRMQVGHPCKRCGARSPAALSYFDMTIAAVADLIGDLYPLLDPSSLAQTDQVVNHPESNRLGVLVFFCTLGEVLLEHFLQRCMVNMKIPRKLQQKLLNDNLFAKQRISQLFPILVNASWADAVKVASHNSGIDFQTTVKFYLEATEKRNLLLHLGNKWAVPPDMAKGC